MLALIATATRRVAGDTLRQLGMRTPEGFLNGRPLRTSDRECSGHLGRRPLRRVPDQFSWGFLAAAATLQRPDPFAAMYRKTNA